MQFIKIINKHPELIHALSKFPPRVKVAKEFEENELLVFIKKGRLYIHCAKYDQNEKPVFLQTTFEEAFNRIACLHEEKSLKLSQKFWGIYEEIKNFREFRLAPRSERSLEQQAINNLKTFLNRIQDDRIFEYKDFLKTLLEDILDFGTLPDFTLRRIANLQNNNEKNIERSISEIKALKDELGENYLEQEKSKQKDLSKEIIVAIENQKL
ncbi:MAG: hypothetical protein A2Y62_16145 [Candidatus Fischerbacteria bacterium RBG_13_37_8]|uniref:Uncharacterized protein n=1 Tax=Candidatus Fischerbacteria bacterium RBG_13_37_8 TaxID=1817863 RepID=A0A1F5VDT0_9BACT|nr:MAG: hypothetical protein A2Y62_16145 [Candidatus Fischerbacteria bacterium RBG_13_37_8]